MNSKTGQLTSPSSSVALLGAPLKLGCLAPSPIYLKAVCIGEIGQIHDTQKTYDFLAGLGPN